MSFGPLAGLRVVQLDGQIEVAYCTKILVDAGVDVVMVEAPDGHPMRRRSSRGIDLGSQNSPLFDYLNSGKRSSTLDGLAGLLTVADVLVTDTLPEPWEVFHQKYPGLTAVSITPFGLEGPWAGLPASDLTLQAMSGGMASRGHPDREPLMVGGEPCAWFSGAIAAVSLLGVIARAMETGIGELIDVSMLEAAHLEHNMYPITYESMAGRPFNQIRGVPVPGIEPTLDGLVGFFVITGQQWLDFCSMIGRPDWLDDSSLLIALERRRRRSELIDAIRSWTRERTTEEITEIASLLRIPVAPIGNGATVLEMDHFRDQDWFVENLAGFLQPRRPYRLGNEPAARFGSSPQIARPEQALDSWREKRSTQVFFPPNSTGPLPLRGIKVADFTGFWAGPFAGQFLAGLGADVIHVEGPHRPDGIRMNTLRAMEDDEWWEWSPLFCGANTNKRGIAVDLSAREGREIALTLLDQCDVMIENFSPRVIEQLGLGPKQLIERNSDLVVVRMPAFGIEGPWKNRVGFAQTIEQVVGLANVTGYKDEAPVIPNGMCDPLAGVHAAVAILVALANRATDGGGMVVEAPMIGGALNTVAEQILEYSVFGEVQTSLGNSSLYLKQGVYQCKGKDRWVAISFTDESTQDALTKIVGSDSDEKLKNWCFERSADEIVEVLWGAGIAVGPVVWPHEIVDNPQMRDRGFFEELSHPLCGSHPYTGWPAKISGGPRVWNREPSPTLGQHNLEVLSEVGIPLEQIDKFRGAGIIAEVVTMGQDGW